VFQLYMGIRVCGKWLCDGWTGTSCYRVYSKVEDLQRTIEKWRKDEKKELWLLCWIGIRGRQLTSAVLSDSG
jgi:hypothetical protein